MRGGRPRLESADCESQRFELLRQMRRRRLAGPPAADLAVDADVDAPPAERARSHDDGARAESAPFDRLDAEHARAHCRPRHRRAAARPSPGSGEVGPLLDQRPHGASVETAVALRAWRPDCGPLAPVQHAELHHGEIRRAPHDAAERIDLAHDGALGHAADRGVAGHLADALERTRDERDARAEPRRRDRGLRPRVPTTDYENVERGFEGHGGSGVGTGASHPRK